jgi:hypothetical protein
MVRGKADPLADVLDRRECSSRQVCFLPELEIRCHPDCVRGAGICFIEKMLIGRVGPAGPR